MSGWKLVMVGVIALPFLYLGLVHSIASIREARSEAAYPPEGLFVDVGGARVHAVIEGEGPDVVLIHGAGGNARDFTLSFSSNLAARGYRVITFDRPGFGYSDPVEEDPASLILQAGRLQQAAATLGADKPIVVGHSLGGAVAMAWATSKPDHLSGLVSIAGVTNFWPGPTEALYVNSHSWLGRVFLVPGLAAFISEAYIANVIEGVFEPQAAPEGYADHIGAGLTIRRASLHVNAAERVALKENVVAMVPDYPAITVPVEILHGDVDIIVSLDLHSEKLVEQIDGANLTVLEGIGHMPNHTSQPEVFDAIDRVAMRAGLK
ncbi:MAG: alpha/beta hydrolase [Pseudomonadota bacterium]